MRCLYRIGLIVGRFQILHRGHEEMVRKALDLCDKVVVYIGSSQEAGTEKNPFSYSVREQMFESVFASEVASKRLLIRPLPDIGVGNNDIWGRYILGLFEAEFHRQPDLYITGCEKERPSWFPDTIAPAMDELRLTRKTIAVSGQEVRDLILKDYKALFEANVPYELYEKYDFYRDILTSIKDEKSGDLLC